MYWKPKFNTDLSLSRARLLLHYSHHRVLSCRKEGLRFLKNSTAVSEKVPGNKYGAFHAQCKYEFGTAHTQNYTNIAKTGVGYRVEEANIPVWTLYFQVNLDVWKSFKKTIQLDQFLPFSQMPRTIISPCFPLLPPLLQSPVDITLFTVCWHGKYFRVK